MGGALVVSIGNEVAGEIPCDSCFALKPIVVGDLACKQSLLASQWCFATLAPLKRGMSRVGMPRGTIVYVLWRGQVRGVLIALAHLDSSRSQGARSLAATHSEGKRASSKFPSHCRLVAHEQASIHWIAFSFGSYSCTREIARQACLLRSGRKRKTGAR